MHASFTNNLVRGALSAAILLAFSNTTLAAGAVAIQDFDGGPGAEHLMPGGTLFATGFAGLASSMSDNPNLDFSSWAHTGAWWQFHLMGTADVTVRVDAQQPGSFAPGVSVWTSGANPFDGGTTAFGGETSDAGFGTPHSFNSTGQVGNRGTLWMTDGQGGNMLEHLGYAISGPTHLSPSTGWDEDFVTGAHDGSATSLFESGVSGSTGAGFVELLLSDLQAGYYTLYVGGTDASLSGGLYNLSVSAASAVPVPAAVWLFGSGLLGLVGMARRQGQAEA